MGQMVAPHEERVKSAGREAQTSRPAFFAVSGVSLRFTWLVVLGPAGLLSALLLPAQSAGAKAKMPANKMLSTLFP